MYDDDTPFDFFDKVSIGNPVPAHTFEAFHENSIKKMQFSDFEGKWLVVFFYPADFTFVCSTELEELADHYEEFKKLNTEVLSVSTDTVYVHKAWHDQSPSIKKITFPMVADPTHVLSKAFGVYLPEEGVALRGSFIIGDNGILQAQEINANNIGRNAQELLRKLYAAKYVHDNGGKVCPASWQPGKDTLEPGLDLVGKL